MAARSSSRKHKKALNRVIVRSAAHSQLRRHWPCRLANAVADEVFLEANGYMHLVRAASSDGAFSTDVVAQVLTLTFQHSISWTSSLPNLPSPWSKTFAHPCSAAKRLFLLSCYKLLFNASQVASHSVSCLYSVEFPILLAFC